MGRGKWRGNRRVEWVASKRHMTAEHRLARAVQSLQTDVYSSPASSRLNWRPRRFKWTRPFRRNTKSGFCACAITFQTQSTSRLPIHSISLCHHSHLRNRVRQWASMITRYIKTLLKTSTDNFTVDIKFFHLLSFRRSSLFVGITSRMYKTLKLAAR